MSLREEYTDRVNALGEVNVEKVYIEPSLHDTGSDGNGINHSFREVSE